MPLRPDHILLTVSGGSILVTKRTDSPEGPSYGLSVSDLAEWDIPGLLSGRVDEGAYFDAHSMRALAYAILSMTED